MKAYVVSRVGWEYNDDNYYRSEDQGGIPLKGYHTRGRAEAECLKMNVKEYKKLAGQLDRYSDYRHNLCEMVADGCKEEFEKVCKAYDIYSEMEIQCLDSLTDQQLSKVIPCLDVQLYQVDEIEYEDDEHHGDFVG
jgi:hypothetical protein